VGPKPNTAAHPLVLKSGKRYSTFWQDWPLIDQLKALTLLMAVSLFVSCAARQEYFPQGPGEMSGYSDLRLSDNRYSVSFRGGSGNTQDDVEDYLLRRAAEVTLEAGYGHFVFTRYNVLLNRRYSRYGGPPIYSYPNPSYWNDSTEPVSSYSAYAEILLLRPEEAIPSAQAIDAVEILYGAPSVVAQGQTQVCCAL
jgi:hypothetical protein